MPNQYAEAEPIYTEPLSFFSISSGTPQLPPPFKAFPVALAGAQGRGFAWAGLATPPRQPPTGLGFRQHA